MQAARILVDGQSDLVPVSSTHLYNTPPMIVDLYTRMCSLNITASQLALMGACYANGGVNPAVSYTHLDVYKRQVV